jgi:hypothetical protein
MSLNSILQYGGDAGGGSDNSAAFKRAMAANPRFPSVYFPPGKCAFHEHFE